MAAPVDSALTVQAAKETLDSARPHAHTPARAAPFSRHPVSSKTLARFRPSSKRARVAAVAFEISRLLDTGLDKETLSVLISLVESGVHPEALAAVVKELRREAAELKARL
jgi:mitotic-spindle organizing protein 1